MNFKRFGGLGIIITGGLAIAMGCWLAPIARAADAPETPRQRTLLDSDWLFHLGDISPVDRVVTTSYEDSLWRRVDVPHDYVLDGTYASANDRGHGYLPIDVGWYRKRVTIPEGDRGKILRLDFDGVFRDSEVWLNGKSLGKHLSGYTPFSFDITKLAKIGEENLLVVRVDPRKGEGWWYEGGGIYRHVALTTLAPVHVAQWGTHVVSKVADGAESPAELTIQTTVENAGTAPANCKVVSEIVGPEGDVIKTLDATEPASPGENHEVTQHTTIDHPSLWSIESPKLYQLRTTVSVDDKAVDYTTTNFGVRTLRYDANQGFFLNGKHVEIQGTASHQDFAGVGIAVPDSLQAWRVEQLKKLGCNAWRTAHNPPSEALLDACDRLGMMVMDENRHLGATYLNHSPKGTPAGNLEDLATMIQRDRNHPSIIMWSMCNEEGMQGTPEGAAIFKQMMNVVHRYDETRVISSAMNAGWLRNGGDADVEDIVGVNYNTNQYDAVHAKHPTKTIFGSEDTNEKTTRGEYADVPSTGMRSAYNLSEENWLAVIDRPFMAGSFTWTGFDYKGEPNPYGWPDVSNNTGLVDTCGFPKDKAYYFKSCWTPEPMVHLVPSTWNWPKDGEEIRVLAFTNAKHVELFLNGKSLGAKDVAHDAHAEWTVPYAHGKLTAKALDGEKTIATDELQTTGKAAHIQLTVDRKALSAGSEDAVVATVTLMDERGRVVSDDDHQITYEIGGGGRILGTGNGNPADHDPDHGRQRKTFHGRGIVVLEAGAHPGKLEVTASSTGLESGKLSLEVN